ncbi:hypothetical protein QBC43DRAFT_303939 [Cladorrhinum sp. PSN259]|nr:hypothetical protein QBC43DRAFT_303939 [Cladorrhinum sp. PSN259]
MDANRAEVEGALSLIEEADLPHPSGPLLASFIKEALHPVMAARYTKEKLLLGEGSSLLANWSYIIESNATARQAIIKRDGNRCCITGKPGTLHDPLVVAPILPVPSGWNTDKEGIFDMLGVFFGPPYRDWWLSYAKNPRRMLPYSNHWLVRRSAAQAFAQGLVKLDRRQPSMVEYELIHVHIKPHQPIEADGLYPLLGDHSRQNIEKVDARFIGSHARLCESIQFVDISKTFLPKTPPCPSARERAYLISTAMLRPFTTLSRFFVSAVFKIWRTVFPSTIRFAAYGMLLKFGRRIYGQEHSESVQRLPFRFYLKHHGVPCESLNEFNALQLVRQNTSIPIPTALDVVISTSRNRSGPLSSEAYLLTTKTPGLPLSRCQHVLSDTDYDQIVSQLRDYVAQIREIPNKFGPGSAICNTLGEACRDTRIRGASPVGPLADEAAFSQLVAFSDEPARRRHKIVFTHADLNPRDILVDRNVRYADGTFGRGVSGIVDWESARHYPEYWEYTKAMFEGFRWTRRYNNLVHEVFKEFGDYSQELDVERRSWGSGDAV